MRDFLAITKALSDINRLRALMALREKELCVCQITELLSLAPSTVSKHMTILKQAYLIDSRKEGRWVYYRLSGNEAGKDVKAILNITFSRLENDAIVQKDKIKLKKILETETEELCKKLKGK